MNTNITGSARLCVSTFLSIVALPILASGQNVPAPSESSSGSPEDTVVLDEMVVSGVRAGLENAIELKRQSDVIVDAISSEDLGKFPDQNVAESLQRVNGVQIERSRGEGTRVSVRGLDPKFNSVKFNGRTLTSANGGGRSFSFLLLQPEFLGSLEVYKTSSADMEEGALSATINARTIRPLDLKDRRIVLNAEIGYDENSTKWEPRLSAIYSNTFNDGKVGLLVGLGQARRRAETHQLIGWGFERGVEAQRGYPGNGGGGQPLDFNVDGDYDDTVRFNHAVYFLDQPTDRKRTNAVATLQFKPADSFELYFDTLYADFGDEYLTNEWALRYTNILDLTPDTTADRMANPGGVTFNSDAIVDSVVENLNGELHATYLDADGIDFRNNSRTIITDVTTYSIASGFKWNGGGPLRVDGEIARSYSRQEFSAPGLEVIGRASAAYDMRDNPGGVPVVTFQRGFNPLDPSSFRATSFNGQIKEPRSDKSTDISFDADLDTEWGAFPSLEFGTRYSDRAFFQGSGWLYVPGDRLAALTGQTVDASNPEGPSISAAPYMGVVRPASQFMSAIPGGNNAPQEWLLYRPDLFHAVVSMEELLADTPAISNPSFVSNVRETTLAGYLKGNFSGRLGDIPYSGNIGVRVVQTRQTSDGYSPNLDLIIFQSGGASTIVPTSEYTVVNRKYTDVLPSANVLFKLSDRIDLRAAASRVMSRPDLGLLSTGTSVNANVRTIDSNNPYVDPYMADTFDVSVEYYPAKGSQISLAGYYKNIDSFIERVGTPETRTVRLDVGGTTEIEFVRSAPTNGNGTTIQGFEASFQQAFGRGFGAVLNYTYVDAGTVRPLATGATPALLTGISENNYNVIGYYENRRFGVRVAYNHRDGFITEERNPFGDGEKAHAYNQLDATVNVRLNDRLSLSLSALNITDAYQRRTTIVTGFSRLLEDNGRRFLASLRATF